MIFIYYDTFNSNTNVYISIINSDNKPKKGKFDQVLELDLTLRNCWSLK